MVYNEKGWNNLHNGLNASYLLLSFTDLEIMLHNEIISNLFFFCAFFFFFRERALTASWQLYRRQLHNTDGACCLRFGNRIFIFLSYISLSVRNIQANNYILSRSIIHNYFLLYILLCRRLCIIQDAPHALHTLLYML